MTKWLNILSHQLNPSQTTSGFPPTSFRVVIIEKKNNNKCWQGLGTSYNFHYGCECNLVQLLQK